MPVLGPVLRGEDLAGGLIPAATYTPADRQTAIGVVDLTSPGFMKIIAPYMDSPVASSMTFTPELAHDHELARIVLR